MLYLEWIEYTLAWVGPMFGPLNPVVAPLNVSAEGVIVEAI